MEHWKQKKKEKINKEVRREGTEERKREEEETKKRENDRSKKGSKRIGNLGWEWTSGKIRGEIKAIGISKIL